MIGDEYDGEPHEAGSLCYPDERHAWELYHRPKVRVCTFADVDAVRKGWGAAGARPRTWPHLSMDMLL